MFHLYVVDNYVQIKFISGDYIHKIGAAELADSRGQQLQSSRFTMLAGYMKSDPYSLGLI